MNSFECIFLFQKLHSSLLLLASELRKLEGIMKLLKVHVHMNIRVFVGR